jgi:hypothetical protein
VHKVDKVHKVLQALKVTRVHKEIQGDRELKV